ncbi:MAG: XF1762 family protein, partial [Bacteroidota bacterium]
MLEVVPITHAEAKAFVARHHRHHKPPVGMKLAVAVSDGQAIRGVATAGRPVARHLNDGWTLEVNRVATDGARNACSMLYGAVRRAAIALGYRRLLTSPLPAESGASLGGAGWEVTSEAAGGGRWSCPSRPRVDLHPTQLKLR